MLSIRNLDLYYGDAQALSDVSLEVGKGETVAIVGANGAGKTSLIRCIAGIERARSGKLFFEQTDITGKESHQICNLGIGQVAEGRQVFPTLSVLDNLQMGAMLPRARKGAQQTLREVFAMFPRLEERQDQLAGTMSGGEQQMLALARALLMRPRLMLLDEPSLGLAPLVVRSIFGIIQSINETSRVAVLLVEQNARIALDLSSTAYVLEVGRIAVSGASAELQGNESVRRSYLGY